VEDRNDDDACFCQGGGRQQAAPAEGSARRFCAFSRRLPSDSSSRLIMAPRAPRRRLWRLSTRTTTRTTTTTPGWRRSHATSCHAAISSTASLDTRARSRRLTHTGGKKSAKGIPGLKGPFPRRGGGVACAVGERKRSPCRAPALKGVTLAIIILFPQEGPPRRRQRL